MAYTLPQALVYQEFTANPLAQAVPQSAHISGGNAELFRFSQSDEKAKIQLGAYDPNADATYSWPNQPAGSKVDLDYVKLWMEDALLQYFYDAADGNNPINIVSGTKNQIKASNVNFAENTSQYPRNASLYDRDVQPGDVVDVRAVVNSQTYSARTTVKSVKGTKVAGTVGAASPDGNNQADDTASATIGQSAGPYNCVTATVDGSSYDGLADGAVSETYTIEVIEGSIGGDFSTAKVRVTSASGKDDQSSVSPATAGNATSIGTRGLTVTWGLDTGACSSSADSQGVSRDDLIVGQKWVVDVSQSFTAPTATAGGTFTGTFSTTYIVEITKGGKTTDTGNEPEFSVTSSSGIDFSGPTKITGSGTDFPVGNYGALIQWDQTAFSLGDKWTFAVTGESVGNMNILELNHNLPDAIVDASPAVDLEVTLYIKKPSTEISRKRTGQAPNVNWVATADDFTLKAGITDFDPSWTSNGTQLELPVVEGTAYVEYRAWLSDLCSQLNALSDVADIDDIGGPLDPDNPLKWGVYKALTNSNGTAVYYTAVCDPSDINSWQDVIDTIDGEDRVYGLVPLTTDRNIVDLFTAHADSQSSAEAGRWKVTWAALDIPDDKVIVSSATSSDGNDVLAVVEDDPNTSGTQYTQLRVPGSNGQFVTNGVRAGDIVRYQYGADGWGDETYSTYTVASVINEDTLLLSSDLGAAESTPKKVEIWRNLSLSEKADEVAANAGTFGNSRVRAVFPDVVGSGGETFPGYHLAAALAGLRSGVNPQQGLTNVEIAGFDDVSESLKFNRTQLDKMAESGVWIVTQNADGNIVTRHALTTAGYGDVLTQEEMVISNVDSISKQALQLLEPLIGQTNVTETTMERIRLTLSNLFTSLQANDAAGPGAQVLGFEILEIRQHEVLKDRIVINMSVTVPVPTNNAELHMQLVA